jgi:hypothetical protein
MIHAAINVCVNAIVLITCAVAYVRTGPEGQRNRMGISLEIDNVLEQFRPADITTGYTFSLMVAFGLFAVVASIGRAAFFSISSTGPVPQLSRSIGVPIFSAVEIDIGMMAASLPAMGAMIKGYKSHGVTELRFKPTLRQRAGEDQNLLPPQPKAMKTVYHYPLSEEVESRAMHGDDQKEHGATGVRRSDPSPRKWPTSVESSRSSTKSWTSEWSKDEEVWGIKEAIAESRLERPSAPPPGSAF